MNSNHNIKQVINQCIKQIWLLCLWVLWLRATDESSVSIVGSTQRHNNLIQFGLKLIYMELGQTS